MTDVGSGASVTTVPSGNFTEWAPAAFAASMMLFVDRARFPRGFSGLSGDVSVITSPRAELSALLWTSAESEAYA
jgi:hypothetical protein